MNDSKSPTPVEEQAVLLLYRKLHPHAVDEPDEAMRAELLIKVREYAIRVGQAALDILRRETRNPPSRGHYSKHMQFFFLVVLFPLLAIVLLIVVIRRLFA